MSTLDVEGPFFVSSDADGQRQTVPLVQQLLRVLLMLAGQPTLWRQYQDSAGDDAASYFLLSVLTPLWQLASSIIHARFLQTLDATSGISRWLHTDQIGPPRVPASPRDGRLQTQLAVRTTVCGLLCCLSRLQRAHSEILRPLTCTGLLLSVGIVDNERSVEESLDQSQNAAGLTEWEAFVLGVLRNVLLVDRSLATRTVLRPFMPWLMNCLTLPDDSPGTAGGITTVRSVPEPRTGLTCDLLCVDLDI
eukprot:COSAG05_NODE_419_length_10002_cov_97.065031_5_plen_249_part_00